MSNGHHRIAINGIPNWQACSCGKIYSIPSKRYLEGRILNGYVQVGHQLGNKKEGRVKLYRAHILICTAFHGVKPSDKPQVNHINGIKHDNRPENLEWVTGSENVLHSMALGLTKTKLTASQAQTIRDEYIPYSKHFGSCALAKKYNVHRSSINAIIGNKTHKNYATSSNK